ncbi:hypothetical protein [Engelhardtia mirabilis]
MGQSDLKGGTVKLGEVDPAAIPTAGPHAAGSICNAIPIGPTVTGLTYSIERGSAGTVTVAGRSAVPFSATGTAHVTLPAGGGLRGGQCADYAIEDLVGDGTGENLVLAATPSFNLAVGSTSIEVNGLPVYRFDALSDLARNGIAELYHAGALALLFNDDPTERITRIDGSVSFPGASSATLTGLHLLEADGDPVPNTSVSISDGEFAITGFAALDPEDWYQVVLVLSAPLAGEPMRLQLQGTFAP